MTIYCFKGDCFKILTNIGEVCTFLEINMMLDTKCHPYTSSINSMMAYDFVATEAIQINIILVQPSYR